MPQASQVTPGFPALSPTYAPASGIGSGGAIDQDQATYSGTASATVAIGGTTGVGPTVTVTVNGVATTYTYGAGDTTTTLAATDIAAAINANASVNSLVIASSATNVVTLTAVTPGLAGMLSLATSTTGGATATASYSLLDLPNSVVVPVKSFAYSAPGSSGPIDFYNGMPHQVDAFTKADLRNIGGLIL